MMFILDTVFSFEVVLVTKKPTQILILILKGSQLIF